MKTDAGTQTSFNPMRAVLSLSHKRCGQSAQFRKTAHANMWDRQLIKSGSTLDREGAPPGRPVGSTELHTPHERPGRTTQRSHQTYPAIVRAAW